MNQPGFTTFDVALYLAIVVLIGVSVYLVCKPPKHTHRP